MKRLNDMSHEEKAEMFKKIATLISMVEAEAETEPLHVVVLMKSQEHSEDEINVLRNFPDLALNVGLFKEAIEKLERQDYTHHKLNLTGGGGDGDEPL